MSRRRRRGPRRSLRRIGPGGRRGGGRGRPRRTIIITSVAPTGDVNSYSPTIRAFVEDRMRTLSRFDIAVYVDGEEMRFNYSRSSGSLTCATGRLSSGTHTVEIEASIVDADGRRRTGRKVWTLNVKK